MQYQYIDKNPTIILPFATNSECTFCALRSIDKCARRGYNLSITYDVVRNGSQKLIENMMEEIQ